MIFIVLALFHSNKRAIFHLFLSSPELSQCPRCAGEMWNCSFISTVRPTVHANPSRKRSFWKTLFKPEEFENTSFSLSRGGKHFTNEAFRNDCAAIILWFLWPSFLQIQIQISLALFGWKTFNAFSEWILCFQILPLQYGRSVHLFFQPRDEYQI